MIQEVSVFDEQTTFRDMDDAREYGSIFDPQQVSRVSPQQVTPSKRKKGLKGFKAFIGSALFTSKKKKHPTEEAVNLREALGGPKKHQVSLAKLVL